MQRLGPISGVGTFRTLLKGQYDLKLWAREKVGRPDDEAARKTQFMRNLYLMLKNMHFILRHLGHWFSANTLEGYIDDNVNVGWNEATTETERPFKKMSWKIR